MGCTCLISNIYHCNYKQKQPYISRVVCGCTNMPTSRSFCNPHESISLSRRVMVTIGSIETWMASNWLRPNQQKTDFLWCGTRYKLAARDLNQLAAISPALISHYSVRDLHVGVILDSELSFEQHASKLTQTCFFHLRPHRAIRRSLTNAALLTLVHAFIATRLDYCNSALFGYKNVCNSSPTVDTKLLSSAVRRI